MVVQPTLADGLEGLRVLSADQILSPYVYVFYAAYLVAFAFTPMLRSVATYYRIIDEPDGIRKLHTRPVAYLGGVAVFLGWLCGVTASQFVSMHVSQQGMPNHLVVNFGIVIGACAIVLLGLWDDILHMRPWQKIFGQVCAGVCLAAFGVGRHIAWLIIQPVLVRTCAYYGWPYQSPAGLGHLVNSPVVQCLSGLLVVGLVVVCCNASNLMDGMDGLLGGVTAIVAAGFLFLAVSMATGGSGVNGNQDALRVVLGLALLAAVLAFVPFNFSPASIFLGDTGSMFIGFVFATMMALFASEAHFKWLLAALVMFSLPLLDTALAFMRRWVNRRPLFSPDRYHFHHQLVARGFTVKQTVIISYGLSIFFCLLGGSIVYMRTRYAVGVWLVVFGSLVVAAYKMGMVHETVKAAVRKPLGSDAAVASTALERGAVLELKEEHATS